MGLNSALAKVELQTLSDLLRQNDEVLKEVDHISTLQEDGIGGGFEKSMRVKAMIDTLESGAQREPSWTGLAALVRSEYRLWKLNDHTPLRVNPFLSHWVEAIQRLDAVTQAYRPILDDKYLEGIISAEDIAATRLEMLKELLKYGGEALMTATPQTLHFTRYPPKPFDIRPFIRMLEEEGIYEPSSASPPPSLTTMAPKVTHSDSPAASSPGTSSVDSPQPPAAPLAVHPGMKWRESILLNLEINPTLAIDQLTHLPIAIAALDFLTTLITGSKIRTHGINPKQIVLSFVQHALRIIEYTGQPPNPAIDPPPETDIGMSTDFGHGRDAQSRAIRLLLLFLKNLMRRGLVDVYPNMDFTLYYDIQEICTQYLWMKEVREFRAWLDEGKIVEDGDGGL